MRDRISRRQIISKATDLCEGIVKATELRTRPHLIVTQGRAKELLDLIEDYYKQKQGRLYRLYSE